jgi:hypothetical protein
MRQTKEDLMSKILNYDWDVRKLLEEKGIKTFLGSDGSTFLDFLGHSYGAEQFFVGSDGWCRAVGKIDWQRDVFIVMKEILRCYALPSDKELKFVGREPLSDAYNGATIEKVAHFTQGGYDGSAEYQAYAVTLLTIKYERR